MVTTSIWSIKNNLNQSINYIINPEKTFNEDYGKDDYDYLEGKQDYNLKKEKVCYISCLNCNEDYPYDDMIDTKDYYIFQSGQNAKEAVDSGRLKRISTGIAADELVGENVNRLGTAIGGTTGLTLGAGNVPNLVLKDEYFDTDKKAYIVVTVTDSKGRNVSRTVRVQFKPELLDLN